MTNYNDGEWHLWNGGECPVHPKSVVDAVWHDPRMGSAGMSGPREAIENPGPYLAWAHVVKFRVVKEYREPREFWVNVYADEMWAAHASKSDADKAAASDRVECIHVREVLE